MYFFTSELTSSLADSAYKLSTLQGVAKNLHMDDEIALASKTGELTSNLRKLYKALSSIPAANIESERVFSVAGSFATKIRSQLSDTTLDNFSFAKCKFRNDAHDLVDISISWIFLLFLPPKIICWNFLIRFRFFNLTLF